MTRAATKPDLQLIVDPLSGFDGQITEANLAMLAARVTDLDATRRELEADLRISKAHEVEQDLDLKKKRLEIGRLKADRTEKALDAPERPQTDVVYACWLAAFPNKRRDMDFNDREAINRAIKNRRIGLGGCLEALAGAHFDSRHWKTRRNGDAIFYNDLKDVFKSFGWIADYRERAPKGWTPLPERVAASSGVPVKQVREWLGEPS